MKALQPIGEPKRIGASLAYAVFFEVGLAAEMAVREASGIEGSVLEPEGALPIAARFESHAMVAH